MFQGAVKRLHSLAAKGGSSLFLKAAKHASNTTSPRAARRADVSDTTVVSVVVVSHNRGHLLTQAVQSILAQRSCRVECIVVDDASQDEATIDYLHHLAQNSEMKVFRHTQNRGLAAARNTGLMCASGGLITFVDDDDYLCYDSLKERLKARQPSYCDWVSVAGNDCLDNFLPIKPAAARADIDITTVSWKPPFIASAPLIRRTDLIAAGGFNEALSRGEDTELWFRMIRDGARFNYVKHIGVAYRRTTDSMVKAAPLQQLEVLFSLADIFDSSTILSKTEGLKSAALLEQSLTYLIMAVLNDDPLSQQTVEKYLPKELYGTVMWEEAKTTAMKRAANRCDVALAQAKQAAEKITPKLQAPASHQQPSSATNMQQPTAVASEMTPNELAQTRFLETHTKPLAAFYREPLEPWRSQQVDRDCQIVEL